MKRNICVLTGEKAIDGSFLSFAPKKMCVNCASCVFDEDGETYTCNNEENQKNAFDKIKEAINNAGVSSYSIKNIDSLVLEPLPIKKPTAKCGKWELNGTILDELEQSFV